LYTGEVRLRAYLQQSRQRQTKKGKTIKNKKGKKKFPGTGGATCSATQPYDHHIYQLFWNTLYVQNILAQLLPTI
jgi:hypothetical protein